MMLHFPLHLNVRTDSRVVPANSIAKIIDITHRDWQHQALNGNRLVSDVTL